MTLGHTRIAHITGVMNRPDATERHQGYLDAHRDAEWAQDIDLTDPYQNAVAAWNVSRHGADIGPWTLHPLVLLFVLSGSLMISKTLRIPKP